VDNGVIIDVPLLSDRFKSNPVAVGVVEKTKRSEKNE